MYNLRVHVWEPQDLAEMRKTITFSPDLCRSKNNHYISDEKYAMCFTFIKKLVEISWSMCSFCSESKENNSHCDCIWSFSNVHVKYKNEFLSSPHAYLPSSQKFSTLVLTWGQQPKILGMSPWLFWETILVPEITIVGHGSCREFTWLFLLK